MKKLQFHDDFLKKQLSSFKRIKTPEGTVKRLYSRIKEEEDAQHAGFVSNFFHILRLRREIVIAVLATLLLAVPLTFFSTKSLIAMKTGQKVYVVRFIHENESAQSVKLIGDFNNWNSDAIDMQRISGTPFWSTEITLREGLYKYVFLVDEAEWTTDPLAPIIVKDNFGQQSSIIVLLDDLEENNNL